MSSANLIRWGGLAAILAGILRGVNSFLPSSLPSVTIELLYLLTDILIIQKAFEENWILITSDKDFGEKVYREQRLHRGIVLLRLENERSANKIDILRQLIDEYADQLADSFIVVTEKQVRFAKKRS